MNDSPIQVLIENHTSLCIDYQVTILDSPEAEGQTTVVVSITKGVVVVDASVAVTSERARPPVVPAAKKEARP